MLDISPQGREYYIVHINVKNAGRTSAMAAIVIVSPLNFTICSIVLIMPLKGFKRDLNCVFVEQHKVSGVCLCNYQTVTKSGEAYA